MTNEISIRRLVVEQFEENPKLNALDLVDPVVDSIPDDQLRDYLRDTLRTGSVHTILAIYRNQNMKKAMGAVTPDAVATKVKTFTVDTPSAEPVKTKPVFFSAKREIIRDGMKKFLQTSIPVEGGHKFLKDATRMDIQFQATQRRNKADALQAEASKWDAILAIMEKHDVDTVGELPEDALLQARNIQND